MSWKLDQYLSKSFGPYFDRASFPVWVIAAAAVCTLIYQINDRQDDRVRSAEEMHKLYDGQPQILDQKNVKEIVLLKRCEFLHEKELLSAEFDCSRLTDKQSEQMSSVNLDARQREELRERLEEVLKDVPLDEAAASERLDFFLMVLQCAENGSCDGDTVRVLFERDMTNFLNNICSYVKSGSVLEDLRKETEVVAKFLLDGYAGGLWWTEDTRRENPFLCPYLREISIVSGKNPRFSMLGRIPAGRNEAFRDRPRRFSSSG